MIRIQLLITTLLLLAIRNQQAVAQQVVLIGTDEGPCTVTDFALALPTGVPTDDALGFSDREPSERIDDGYMFCSDLVHPRNIKVITTGNCTENRINIRLDDAVTGANITKRVERAAPYYLYGNYDSDEMILGGNFMNTSRKYKLRANPVGHRKYSKEIQFEVISCFYFTPANECSSCAASGKVCEGSRCASTGYIRITLLKYDSSYFDYALTVTTPAGGVFGAINDPLQHEIDTPSVDPAGSGGYVDVDFKYSSCRSFGVWVKNIVFPSKELAPKGTYNINLKELSECGFDPVTPSEFVLKIYVDEVLTANFTHLDGFDFSFTI